MTEFDFHIFPHLLFHLYRSSWRKTPQNSYHNFPTSVVHLSHFSEAFVSSTQQDLLLSLSLIVCFKPSTPSILLRSTDTDHPSIFLETLSSLISLFFSNHTVVYPFARFISTSQTEVDVFLELSCLFNDPVDVGNLVSGSSAFSKSSLNIWKFMVHVLFQAWLGEFWALLC